MQKAMEILEFEKIRAELKNYTLTVPGASRVAAMEPLTALSAVAELQGETSEGKELLLQGGLSIKGCSDLMPLFQRAKKGGLLSPGELKEVEGFLKALEAVKKYFNAEGEREERFPRLSKLVEQIKIFPRLTAELEKCLTPGGEIKDSASFSLFSLRVEEKNLQEKIRRLLESFLKTPAYQKYLQENIVTMRHNRYVLPVKQEFRRHIPGVIHDQSASGITLFIEPLEVLELNNRLQEVKGRIAEEIEKILRRLAALVGSHYEALVSSYELYGDLDFILARGSLSIKYRAREPLLNDRGIIIIAGGRHPLLPAAEVVPLDIHLGRDFTTLVITGPNTGGKTVALKTIGLFVLMAQCGLHVPAESGTNLGVFAGVWADIGDEQNIEQSLSTFSGHMLNIIEILSKAAPPSLVLLDELGAGTDPSEGSALAMAILEELHSRGVRTVATTHLNELKVFAHLRDGMENASMEFNPLTLKPSFKLLLGLPGQSNALIIAERLGMPGDLTARARSYMRRDLVNLEEVVADLTAERQRVSSEYARVKKKEEELSNLLQEVKKEKEALEQKKNEHLQKARREAAEIIRETRRRANEILQRLNRLEQEKRTSEALRFGQEAKKGLQELEEEIFPLELHEEIEGPPLALEEAKEGQEVNIKSLRRSGKIIKAFSPEEILVQVGTLKISTVLKDLQKGTGKKVEEEKKAPGGGKKEYGDLLWEKSAAVSRRLDLRGLTLEEAILKLEKHLDDSILANLDKIEIIHGKGTGRLRRGLHHYLENKEEVESFRLGQEGEGGSGVTIVQLKKA